MCFGIKMHFKVGCVQTAFTELPLGFSDPVLFFSLYHFVDSPPHYVLDLARLVGIFSITWFLSLELLCVSLCVEQ